MVMTQEAMKLKFHPVDSMLYPVKSMLDPVEKLVSLQFNTGRVLFENGSAFLRDLMHQRDVGEIHRLSSMQLLPLLDAVVTSWRQGFEIMIQTTEGAIRPYEAQAAEVGRYYVKSLEKAVKSLPVGSDAAMDVIQGSVKAADASYSQVTKAARQLASMTESSLDAVSNAAMKIVNGMTVSTSERKVA